MVQRALALGARTVLAKPFDMHDLPRMVRTAHAAPLH